MKGKIKTQNYRLRIFDMQVISYPVIYVQYTFISFFICLVFLLEFISQGWCYYQRQMMMMMTMMMIVNFGCYRIMEKAWSCMSSMVAQAYVLTFTGRLFN